MKRSLLPLLCFLPAVGCVVPSPTQVVEPPPPVPDRGYEGVLEFDDMATLNVDPSTLRSGDAPCHEPMLVEVGHVVDGDTFDFEAYQGGSGGRVRVIGVDTPEMGWNGAPSDCYGPEARSFTNQLSGHLVWLTFDRGCRDSYGRHLAYVHLGSGDADMFERQLLRRGLARVHTFSDTDTWAGLFEDDEDAAQENEAGLWSACD